MWKGIPEKNQSENPKQVTCLYRQRKANVARQSIPTEHFSDKVDGTRQTLEQERQEKDTFLHM